MPASGESQPLKPLALARITVLLAPLVAAGLAPARAAQTGDAAPRDAPLDPGSSLAALPVSFEANRGQVNGQVQFLSRSSGYTLFLTPRAAVVAMPGGGAARLQFEGANGHSRVTGMGKLPGRVNYFLGKNPARWYTDIPTYARVEYRNIYRGIDLMFHGAGEDLDPASPSGAAGSLPSVEYDWILHPGAEVSRIRLDITGTAGIELDRAGDLVLGTGRVRIVQRAPVVYQRTGVGIRVIPARYALALPRPTSTNRGGAPSAVVGFSLGPYDHTRPLIIDPTLVYSTYLGGSDSDGGAGIAIDGKGDAYVTGDTLSLNFPTAHAVQPTLQSDPSCAGNLANPGDNCVDAFVTKLSPNGSSLLYSTYLGGTLDDYGYAIAVDSQGDAYVTGGTISPDFPTLNALQSQFNGGSDLGDAFVAELSPTGDRLLFSTYLGGQGDQDAQGIALYGGNVYLTGRTNSPSFPLSHPFQGRLAPGKCSYEFSVGKVRCYAAFVSELSGDGQSLVYSTYLGGNSTAFGWSIAVDQGRAVVVGQTTATNFPVRHAVQRTFAGARCGVPGGYYTCNDAFVTELDPTGQSIVFSTYLGGTNEDIAHAVAVDQSGDVYVAGETQSRHFPIVRALQPRFRGDATQGFLTKLNPAGTRLLYSTYLGGTGVGGDIAYAVAVGPTGDAFVAGSTTSANFPLVHAFDAHLAGGGNVQNGFITKLNPSGTTLLYSSLLGGTNHDLVGGVVVDSAGHAYVTGFATSTNFPTAHPLQRRLAGGTFDAIVAKIG